MCPGSCQLQLVNIRERELLEHHLIQPNDCATEMETYSTLLLMYSMCPNAGVKICKMQIAVNSLFSMNFPSRYEVEVMTRK